MPIQIYAIFEKPRPIWSIGGGTSMKFSHRENAKIEFQEIDGELWFGYREFIDFTGNGMPLNAYRTEGIVPADVIAKGQTATLQFAKRIVDEEIGKQKVEKQTHDTFAAHPNVPLEVPWDGKVLQGTIIRALRSTLVVKMSSPYQGTSSVHYGYASAISGRFLFKDATHFTDEAMTSAVQLLVEIYKREKHKEAQRDLINLTNNLNQANEEQQ